MGPGKKGGCPFSVKGGGEPVLNIGRGDGLKVGGASGPLCLASSLAPFFAQSGALEHRLPGTSPDGRVISPSGHAVCFFREPNPRTAYGGPLVSALNASWREGVLVVPGQLSSMNSCLPPPRLQAGQTPRTVTAAPPTRGVVSGLPPPAGSALLPSLCFPRFPTTFYFLCVPSA